MGTMIPGLGPDLEPAQKKLTLQSNYLKFDEGDNDFAQQYLPELYEQEVERYGNRTIGGFLRMVGAEMPMTSDQVIWSEQNRLHVSYDEVVVSGTNEITVTIDPSNTTDNDKQCAFKVNQTILIYGKDISNNTGAGEAVKCIVVAVDAATGGTSGTPRTATVDVEPYEFADLTSSPAPFKSASPATECVAFVYGSEWQKGSDDSALSSIQPDFTQYQNSPIILRDKFEINGSDTAQIGWVEVATEDGTSGYLWFLKSESETRLRFEDYTEMALVEGELAKPSSGVAAIGLGGNYTGNKGTEGLFSAIENRGHIYEGFSSPNGGSGALADFDEILSQLDFEGAIEENMIFCNRTLALNIDNMIAQVNGSTGQKGPGASYGLFDNEASMALNFGFDGFRRGSYDFYKTDWKYLNDASTRGLTKDIQGVLVPAGTSTVYDQILGSNIRRPFLHVRYRASEADDRRMKSWVTGSVGGAYTNGVDAMDVHFLTERCLVTQAANNFFLFKKG